MPGVEYHGPTHRPKVLGGSDPLLPIGHYEIKVFADHDALDGLLPPTATVVSTGTDKFVFAIPADLHGTELVHAHAYVTTPGAVTVTVRNRTAGVTMLSTAITVDAGDDTSYTAAAPPVVNVANAEVVTGDLICIDVSAADGDAEGLGVILIFAAP